MSKAKVVRLVLLSAGALLALGGCAGGGLTPWLVGAGLVTWLVSQSA